MPSLHPHIQMHFFLLEQIKQTNDTQIKKTLCLQDISILQEFKQEWIIQADEAAEHSMMMGHLIGENFPIEHYKQERAYMYELPNYPSFKTLAIIYEKEGDYESAISICKDALAAGIYDDGTKGGMRSRLGRLIMKAG